MTEERREHGRRDRDDTGHGGGYGRVTPETEREIQRILIDLLRMLLRWDLDNPQWLDMHTGRLAFLKELYEARDPSTMQLLDLLRRVNDAKDLPLLLAWVREQRKTQEERRQGLARGMWPEIGKYVVMAVWGIGTWLWMHFNLVGH